MLAPGAGNTFGPFKNIDEADSASILESEWRRKTEDADGGNDNARDVWGIVGGKDNE